MTVAVLSDAHGNLNGTARCLAEIAKSAPDALFFLGDAFGYGDSGEETLALLKAHGARCLMGNHEAMLLKRLPLDSIKNEQYRLPVPEALDSEARRQIEALPTFVSLTLDGRRLLFVHGRPDAPLDGYLYPDGDLSPLSALPYDAVFMGHTHRAFIAQAGGVLAVNPGSCGLPRQMGNQLTWAIYDTVSGHGSIGGITLPPGELLQGFSHADSRVIDYLVKHMSTEGHE